MMKQSIVAMGKICIDLIFSGVERLPELGEEVYSETFTLALGGGPPATLIALQRLGVPVSLGTFLGQGQFSKFAETQLVSSGVRYDNLYRGDEPEPLIISSVISTKDDRSFVSYQPKTDGTGMFGVSERQVYDLYKGCGIAYISLGYDDVWRRLKKEGAILVMDASWHDDMKIDWYKEALGYVDYFTPNEKEAPKLTGTKTAEEALDFLAEIIPNPIVKLSRDGCIFKENGKTVYEKASEKYQMIDSTGAGDAFLAGLMYGIYHDYSLRDSVRLGNITGGNSVTKIGCVTAEINEKELLESTFGSGRQVGK
jgi:sugar/nucleoside kinase (ribokinase family)